MVTERCSGLPGPDSYHDYDYRGTLATQWLSARAGAAVLGRAPGRAGVPGPGYGRTGTSFPHSIVTVTRKVPIMLCPGRVFY